MYTVLFIILLIIAGLIIRSGIKKKKKGVTILGFIILVLTPLFFWLLDFWGEMLWFHNLGYGSRFWEVVLSQFFSAVAGGVFGIIFIFLLTFTFGKGQKIVRIIACGAGVIIGANWGYANWSVFLKYFNSITYYGGRSDPSHKYRILPFQASFYDALYTILIILSVISLIALLFSKLFYPLRRVK